MQDVLLPLSSILEESENLMYYAHRAVSLIFAVVYMIF
jgi:hypothetical protein